MPRPNAPAPDRKPRILVGFAIAAGLTLAAPQAGANTPSPPPAKLDAVGDRLKDIEQALSESRRQGQALEEKAVALAREVAELRAELIRAARETQAHEQALADLAATLAALDEEEKAKAEALAGRRAQLGDLLGALERLARVPPEALIAMPSAPQDTLRSAILLRAAVPELEKQAQALRGEIESLAGLRDEIGARRKAQEARAKALAEERARLGGLLARKATLEAETRAERERAAAAAKSLAAEAGDLRDLLARIDAERKARAEAERKAALAAAQARAKAEAEVRAKAERERRQQAPGAPQTAAPPQTAAAPPQPAPGQQQSAMTLSTLRPARPFSQAQGGLAFPVQGKVSVGFGERGGPGDSRGVTLETLPAAQVVAPYDGQVVFAGPFRDYGLLLIIEHGEGYHTLLAGMERIDSAVSQTLLAGEPVGVMARPAQGSPRLYLELRHNGRPINPLPWLATPSRTLTGKVSG